MKIAIVAGGTGGHIYPGVALAQALSRKDPTTGILFLGSAYGLENRILPPLGFSLKLISARPLLRKFCLAAFTAPFSALLGFFQARAILKSWRADYVFSFGGYASWPVILAALSLRIPFFLHEQNVLPGMVNRFYARWAKKVFLSFAASEKYLKGEVVGNPVRQEFFGLDKLLARRRFNLPDDKKVIVVLGGSQGARRINQFILELLPSLPPDIYLLHVVGKRDFDWVRKKAGQLASPNYQFFNYLDQGMFTLLAAADVVVSRAGATAITEFLALHLPMLLIPFPYAAENHQLFNARVVVENGAGLFLEEKDLSTTEILKGLQQLFASYATMVKACAGFYQSASAERMISYLYV